MNIAKIALTIIIAMAIALTVGVVVMGYQLVTEPGEPVAKIVDAVLGLGVAGGIFAGLFVSGRKAMRS